MGDLSKKQHSTRKESFQDRGRGTIADGFDTKRLRDILSEFRRHSHSKISAQVGGNLRGRLDFLLSHLLLTRGESRRAAELPDLQLRVLDTKVLLLTRVYYML